MRIKDRLYRLPPCPPYDVEATESWLEDMAAQGWMLEKDNIFLGVAAFEKAEPAPVRYRLEASARRVGDFDDYGGAPDPEAEEMNADFGWEYVARRGQFHIYRSPAGGGPELHTDPRVQALAIKSLERRQIHQLLSILLILVINLFAVQLRGGSLLLSAAAAGLPITLLTAFLALWLIAAPVREAVHLGRLKKRLAAGQPLRHDGDWRRLRKAANPSSAVPHLAPGAPAPVDREDRGQGKGGSGRLQGDPAFCGHAGFRGGRFPADRVGYA